MEKKERNIGLGVVVTLVIVGILVIRATLTGNPTNKNVSNENTEMYSNSLSGIVIINGYIPE